VTTPETHPMSRYRVTWVIDIESEGSPEDAARDALRVQRDPESSAVVFEVLAVGSGEPSQTIDLE